MQRFVYLPASWTVGGEFPGLGPDGANHYLISTRAGTVLGANDDLERLAGRGWPAELACSGFGVAETGGPKFVAGFIKDKYRGLEFGVGGELDFHFERAACGRFNAE